MNRKLSNKNKIDRMYQSEYVLFTTIFILVSLIAFSEFLMNGKTLTNNVDGYKQWYSMLVKMRTVIIDFIQGNGFAFWSWDTGLGADYLGNYAPVFCNPLCWLVLFFSKENIDIAYSVIVILSMYLGGIGMLSFLRYHEKEKALCIIGAVSYAFGAWGIVALRHEFFMTQLMLFPWIMLGVDKVWDTKLPFTLIAGIWLSLVNSIYFSYMTSIFVFVYIIVRYLLARKEIPLSEFFKKLARYVFYSVIAVTLAAPVLIPAVYTLLQASTGTAAEWSVFPHISQLLKLIPAFAASIDVNENYSIIGMNIVFVAMIPVMFLLHKRRNAAITLFFICLVCIVLPPLQSMINGFSYPTGRWCYIFAFFFTYAAVECLETKETFQKRTFLIENIWLLVIALLSLFLVMRGVLGSGICIILFVNLFFAGFLFHILQQKGKRERKMKWLTGLVCVNIAVTTLLCFDPRIGARITEFIDRGMAYKIYEGNCLRVVKQMADQDFFRVDDMEKPSASDTNLPMLHAYTNTNIYHQVPSVSEYLSTLNKNWLEFNHLLENGAGYHRRVVICSNDNRSRMDFLLGVRYFLGDNRQKGYQTSQYAGYDFTFAEEKEGISVLKAKHNTSLGYVYENVIPETEYLKYTPLEREQVLMQSAVLEDEDINSLDTPDQISEGELTTEMSSVPCTLKREDGTTVSDNTILVNQANTHFSLQLEKEIQNSEIYVVFTGLERQADTKSPYNIYIIKEKIKKKVFNREGELTGIKGIRDYAVNLGYYESCSGKIDLQFCELGSYTYDSLEIIAVPQNNFDIQADKLSENRLENVRYSANHVEGEIDTKEGGLLYLSILYNKGWQIYIDGEKADKVYQVNTAFTGVEVSPGKHNIVLHYRPVGFTITMILFIMGAVVLIILAFYRRRNIFL